jgi:hypothetical protein
MKFKKGDKVRIVAKPCTYTKCCDFHPTCLEQIGVVKEIYRSNNITVEFPLSQTRIGSDFVWCYFSEQNLKCIKELI